MKDKTISLLILAGGIVSLLAGYVAGTRNKEISIKDTQQTITQTVRAFYPGTLVCHETNNLIVFNQGTNYFKITYSLDGPVIKWNTIKKTTLEELNK